MMAFSCFQIYCLCGLGNSGGWQHKPQMWKLHRTAAIISDPFVKGIFSSLMHCRPNCIPSTMNNENRPKRQKYKGRGRGLL